MSYIAGIYTFLKLGILYDASQLFDVLNNFVFIYAHFKFLQLLFGVYLAQPLNL